MCIGVRVTREKPSPSDIVKREAFHYDDTTGILTIDFTKTNIPFRNVPKLWIPSIPNTDSMDPVFDFGHNNLLISGQDAEDHQRLVEFIAGHPGNIAVYQPQNIIHRVVKIGVDDQGRFFKFRGDNNLTGDPDKIRDDNISHVYAGTIP